MSLLSTLAKYPGKLKWHLKQPFLRISSIINRLRTETKPANLSWLDFYYIQREDFLYQPLIFPNNVSIRRGNNPSILDSQAKWDALQLPKDLSGKTVMDIGCAEGFFVIQSVLAGANFGRGCDMLPNRIQIARAVARAWGIEDKTHFQNIRLHEIPENWQTDLTICLSVLHHLHKGSHDTWRIITQPKEYATELQNMLAAVADVARLTLQQTYFEYAYEYEGPKPANLDYTALGKLWVDAGLYKKVDFIGLSMETKEKDRAIYHAYK